MLRLGWMPDYTGRLVLDNDEKVLEHLSREIDAALAADRFSFDTETTGLEVLKGARMFMFSFTYPIDPAREDMNELIRAKQVRKVPRGKNKPPLWVRSVACFFADRHEAKPAAKTDPIYVCNELRRLFTQGKHCTMFNAKFDLPMIWVEGVNTDAYKQDDYLDLFVLDPGFGDSIVEVREARKQNAIKANEPLPRNLKDLSWLLLGWPQEERDEVHGWLKHRFGTNKKNWKYQCVPTELVSTYACGDTERTLALSYWGSAALAEREQTEIAAMESKLTSVVAEIELNGIPVHEKKCRETRAQWSDIGTKAHDTMLELTGLSSLDYGRDEHLINYAWPAINARAAERGEKQHSPPPSWGAEMLEQFVSKKRGQAMKSVEGSGLHGQFCEALLKRRAADKIIGTYIDPWLLTHGLRHEEDGTLRIHCDLLQDGTDTGRFSSKNPNLQNVPVEARLMTPSAGHSLVFIDYSQIEFRLFAHYAGGDILEAYKKDPKVDFHQAVADMLGIPRKPAKNINFGMLYGMGRKKLIFSLCGLDMDKVEIDLAKATEQVRNARTEEARAAALAALETAKGPAAIVKANLELYDTYQRKFPAARKLYQQCQRRMEERGWIKNLFGRRRYLPKEFAQKALNTLIQGGAADIVKRAMLRVAEALLNGPTEAIRNARILLQIHDELIFEVEAGHEQELIDYVGPIMCAEPMVNVPLLVDAEVCFEDEVWMNKHKLGIVHAAA